MFLITGLVLFGLLTALGSSSFVLRTADLALWVAFLVPWFALVARRCHDMNRPGVFGLWLLATGIGTLITSYLLVFTESDPEGARFDPPTAF